jgi:hypothetical protein
MAKHRAVIIGAGRIGAGYRWEDPLYTHAGAYNALKDRVELVGFVEPDYERASAANTKWGVPVYEDVPTALKAMRPGIVSVCVQPDKQQEVMNLLDPELAVYCEKPCVSTSEHEFVQVNYIRRADVLHQVLRHLDLRHAKLTIWAKDDIHTKCHFDDLAAFWGIRNISYNVIDGGCSYQLEVGDRTIKFDKGGCNGGVCMQRMLQNLLDSIEGRDTLWSSR